MGPELIFLLPAVVGLAIAALLGLAWARGYYAPWDSTAPLRTVSGDHDVTFRFGSPRSLLGVATRFGWPTSG